MVSLGIRMSQNTFQARTIELASLLHYALGASSHLATRVDGTGAGARFSYFFQADPNECESLKAELYSPSGAQIANGLQLLRSQSAIRQTMRSAVSGDTGTWAKLTPTPTPETPEATQ
jgi:hypothetical protein